MCSMWVVHMNMHHNLRCSYILVEFVDFNWNNQALFQSRLEQSTVFEAILALIP